MAFFHHKNQSFRTIDLLGLVVLVAVVVSISGTIVAEALRDDRPQRARRLANSIAQQLESEQTRPTPQTSGGRGPASAQPPLLTSGLIGHDPWGNPYHYMIRKSSSRVGGKNIARIFVWSDGPDGKPESDVATFEQLGEHAPTVKGDDIGVLHEFPVDL